MKRVLLALLLTSLTFANPLGTGWDTVLDSCSGDLDKDGVPEKVQVVEYMMDDDSIVPVELQIFKKKPNGQDSLWFVSRRPLYSYYVDEAGEPHVEHIQISNGALVIRSRLNIVHHGDGPCFTTVRYRYQKGGFYLIGYSEEGNEGCGLGERTYEEKVTSDINFSTGKGILSYKYGQCDEDSPVKLPSNKSITFTLDQCTATKTVNGKQLKLTTADLKNITIANHKYGEISLTIKGESISF